jgi:hypothetical protein
VPGDVTLLSGAVRREEFLEVNKEVRFSYTIKSDSESPIKLPAAEADYFELGDRGLKIVTKSQEVLIRIKPPPTPVPTSGPTPEPTIEPEIDALLTPDNVPTEEAIPVVDKQPEPEIVKQEPVIPSIDSNVILNVILVCDGNLSIDPQNNKISDLCNLVNNVP